MYPDQVAVECLNFGMFPAINFALPPSWAKADFAGYIGRRALPLGVALPARSPADLTQTQTQRETQPNASDPGHYRTDRPDEPHRPDQKGGGGHTQTCVPALPAYLPNPPGPAGLPLFLPTFRPPTPRHRLCPQHNNITDQRQLVNSLLDLHTSSPRNLLSLSHRHQTSFLLTPLSLTPFRNHIRQDGERGTCSIATAASPPPLLPPLLSEPPLWPALEPQPPGS